MFAVEEPASSAVIGFCEVVHTGNQSEPEVKYAYLRSHWGCGFATETLSGLIAYAERTHRLPFLIATTAPANAASHRVMLKAGMADAHLRREEDGTHTQLFHCGLGDSAA